MITFRLSRPKRDYSSNILDWLRLQVSVVRQSRDSLAIAHTVFTDWKSLRRDTEACRSAISVVSVIVDGIEEEAAMYNEVRDTLRCKIFGAGANSDITHFARRLWYTNGGINNGRGASKIKKNSYGKVGRGRARGINREMNRSMRRPSAVPDFEWKHFSV